MSRIVALIIVGILLAGWSVLYCQQNDMLIFAPTSASKPAKNVAATETLTKKWAVIPAGGKFDPIPFPSGFEQKPPDDGVKPIAVPVISPVAPPVATPTVRVEKKIPPVQPSVVKTNEEPDLPATGLPVVEQRELTEKEKRLLEDYE